MRVSRIFGSFLSGWLGCVLFAGLLDPKTVIGAPPGQPFADKSVRIIVPYAPGAAYDRLARIVARRMGRYIPGNPSMVVQNMPGGGGAVATNYLYNVAPKDGSAMAILNTSLVLPQLIGSPAVKFDKAKFSWLGSLQKVNIACMMRKESGITDFSQLLGPGEKSFHFGATAAGASNHMWAVFLQDIGARIKIVSGYAGAAPIYSAMQQGELDGVCSTWDAMRITARPLHGIGAEAGSGAIANIIVQTGEKRALDLPDVPLLGKFLKTERQRAVANALSGADEVTRAFALPPGVPAERVRLLREAFKQSMDDPELKEMTQKSGDELSPDSGEYVEQVMQRIVKETPKDLIAEIKRLFGG